jgi:hypothetical protein
MIVAGIAVAVQTTIFSWSDSHCIDFIPKVSYLSVTRYLLS